MDHQPSVPRILRVRFWEGFEAEVDVNHVANRSLSVKGVSCENPLRFMEIYSEVGGATGGLIQTQYGQLTYEDVKAKFFPKLAHGEVNIGESILQPPFTWECADVSKLCISFTYNTNAFYRILGNLTSQGLISNGDVNNLLDKACILLSRIYTAGQYRVIKHINNNLNMYLISKVVEEVVGRKVYRIEEQELPVTSQALEFALEMTSAFGSLSIHEKMGVALGFGVSFIEERMRQRPGENIETDEVNQIVHQYYDRNLAIDHRAKFLLEVSNTCARDNSFTLAVILDDATETVFDLLWIQDLLGQFEQVKVILLVNTAQISINFSSHMLNSILSCPRFQPLASLLKKRLVILEMYCPFISFQTNYLPPHAKQAIDNADAVYIKGANFFETCQIPQKICYHAFVVFGPVSRVYSGFNDNDAVFARVPEGMAGYIHEADTTRVTSLKQMLKNT